MEGQRSRHSIRLQGYEYASSGGYFVTVVTRGRECLFGEIDDEEMRLNELGEIVQDCWEEIPAHIPTADLDLFVIMPNHVHGIIMIHNDGEAFVGARHASPLRSRGVSSGSLGAIVGSFKSAVSRRAGRELNLANIWQRNYHEHIIRNQADYERIANYIVLNPSQWEDDEENPQQKHP